MGKRSAPRRQSEEEAKATLSKIRVSPRKLNLVAASIRGLDAQTALRALSVTPRRIAGEVKKAVHSAVANAENNHQLDVDRLYVSQAFVGKSLVMKRWRARARGRAGRIVKPFSNLTIVVREREESA